MSLLRDAHGFVEAGSCGDLSGELAALADRVAAVKAELAGAAGGVPWGGSAAEAFHAHAAVRYETLAGLVHDLSDAAAAVKSMQCVVSEFAA